MRGQTLKGPKGKTGDKALKILRYQPTWAAVSFVPTVNMAAACKLVCEIMDPRWYNHPRRPQRATRLFAYLGIMPANLAALHGIVPPGVSPACYNWERAEIVLKAWTDGNSTSNAINAEEPCNFLWRDRKSTRRNSSTS